MKQKSFYSAYTGNSIIISLKIGLFVARSIIPKVKFTDVWRYLRTSHGSRAKNLLVRCEEERASRV